MASCVRPRPDCRSRSCVGRTHGFSEASYYLWRSKFGGMTVPEAKRLKDLEAEQMFENDVIKDALRKKW